jgi:hypothetical protein
MFWHPRTPLGGLPAFSSDSRQALSLDSCDEPSLG